MGSQREGDQCRGECTYTFSSLDQYRDYYYGCKQIQFDFICEVIERLNGVNVEIERSLNANPQLNSEEWIRSNL